MLLAIAANVSMLLMTGFVVHIILKKYDQKVADWLSQVKKIINNDNIDFMCELPILNA